jgi:ATP synthase protein I
MQRSALTWAVPVALGCVVVLGLLRGPAGAGSALAGSLIALGAFVSGGWAIGLLLDHLPGAAVVGALTIYLTQLLLLVSAVLVLRELGWTDDLAAAVGLLATALAHQVGQVLGFLRARTLYVDPPLP